MEILLVYYTLVRGDIMKCINCGTEMKDKSYTYEFKSID